ncbi:hypothetical protein LTR37_015587 [Vermiconidia calcicola]|uniref:Uncharacterized protein n=1 Tax=Vermiconidia calcicola TaxID=1690605 RepID=A0ACC3MQA4_9PEZI|nr:hypothetical protein LTR37_015587 [Vermiconidia calcicola]
MAKTPKVKKREVSFHSRAARRGATSPPPKDLEVKPPTNETEYKPWLHNAQNAGIGKKKKSKPLSRQQRQRQQKGLEHGERNVDRMEKKVADSKTRGRKVQARRTEWEELNDRIVGKENREKEDAKSVKKGKEGGAKEMEGVEMPDLEQPLPVRVADTAVGGDMDETAADGDVAPMDEATQVPAVLGAITPVADDVDEVT